MTSTQLIQDNYLSPTIDTPIEASTTDSTRLLSIILPTRNEAKNVEPMLERINNAIQEMTGNPPIEVIFVDDSADDTPKLIRTFMGRYPFEIRLIARPPNQRTGGLGGAVVEGFRAARGYWMCVMDADLQHPPEMVPKLLRHAQDTECDLVIGSRFVDGASTPGLNQLRTAISETLILSARVLFINQLRNVKDPLTGFFLIKRNKLDLTQLHPNGFKILLEIIVQFPALKLSELGFKMESRLAGESKASMQEVTRYFRKLIQLKMTHADPRFFYFLVVGISGILANSAALAVFKEFFQLPTLVAAALATQVSTLWNFLLTEFWVFGDRRATGSLWKRLLGFALINNALLLVRAPVIAWLGNLQVHYQIANLVSIGVATGARYFLADKFLWTKKDRKAETTTQRDSSLTQPLQQSQV